MRLKTYVSHQSATLLRCTLRYHHINMLQSDIIAAVCRLSVTFRYRDGVIT